MNIKTLFLLRMYKFAKGAFLLVKYIVNNLGDGLLSFAMNAQLNLLREMYILEIPQIKCQVIKVEHAKIIKTRD